MLLTYGTETAWGGSHTCEPELRPFVRRVEQFYRGRAKVDRITVLKPLMMVKGRDSGGKFADVLEAKKGKTVRHCHETLAAL